MDYAALKAEIESGPLAAELAPLVARGSDGDVANALNAVRPEVTADRATIPAHEVFEAIVPAEWAALSAAEKQRVQTVLGMGSINLKGGNTRASLAAAFAPGTVTRTNLVALQQAPTSRALKQFGVNVTADDVQKALRPNQ